MRSLQGKPMQIVLLMILVVSCAYGCFSQQLDQTLRGQVEDQLGGLIVGATVTLVEAAGTEKICLTDSLGNYKFSGLAPGKYALRASAPGFAVAEKTGIEIHPGNNKPTNFKLEIATAASSVTVDTERSLSTDLNSSAGSTVLRGEQLDALPDDPDDLAAMLRAMAGPGAGLSGGQFLVDGYSGGSLPSKSSIREVRLNENPFSSEYDKLGFGRVEIITKAGTDKLRGQFFLNFNDESLNARNPFAANRAPFQSRYYGGSVSGPINNKLSYFLNVDQRDITDNAVVNAIVLDDALQIAQFNQAVIVPQTRTTISPRLDFQINPRHALVLRYTFLRLSTENAGVGDFSLPSTAFDTSFRQHNLQLTETAILSPSIVNELRFQFVSTHRKQKGDNSIPNLRVLEAFTGGGSPIGLAFNDEKRFELQDNVTVILPRHILRGGARLRGVRLLDSSSQNFGGTFTFAGGLAPQLNANNELVLDPTTGQPVFVQISSIERYRRTLFFQQLDPASLRLLGGGATQFSIAAGNPDARVSRLDLGAYFQDDWQVRPGLTLGLGLRYETQNNINGSFNFAPRLSFAWAPGAKGNAPKTVIRGGFGIFYDRVSETLTLQAERFNGINQSQFVITDPELLASFPNVPVLGASDLSSQIIRRDTNLQAPYSIQSGISVERKLPFKTTMAVSFVNTRVLHALRSRNINAPLPGTVVPGDPNSGVYPLGPIGNIFQYESSGVFKQNQLVFNLYNDSNRYATVFGSFILNNAKGDTDGAESFPANSYDLTQEYGRAAMDSRYRFIGGGSFQVPWGIRLSPIVIASSGRPFNITTGRDTNGDTLFTERPSFATDLRKPGVVVTDFGAFDTNPEPGQTIIPRNFGEGPTFFVTILRVNKTFSLGNASFIAGKPGEKSRRGEQPYKLSLSVQIMNLFNHTNAGTVIGNLSSPLFGQSNATSRGSFSDGSAAGSFNSRRIELQLRFNF